MHQDISNSSLQYNAFRGLYNDEETTADTNIGVVTEALTNDQDTAFNTLKDSEDDSNVVQASKVGKLKTISALDDFSYFAFCLKIDKSLADLTFFHGAKYENWQESIKMETHHMHSFSDDRVQRMCDNGEAGIGLWMKFNESHMSRIYPKGLVSILK